MADPDWLTWHHEYDDTESSLVRRLDIIRAYIGRVLDERIGQRTHVISACAGEGRDIIGATAEHQSRESVTASLIELFPSVAAVARHETQLHGLHSFTVVEGDAGSSDVYAEMVPANLLLFCGIFGWISNADIFRTIDFLPRLAAPGATVIWTRHHRPPDFTGAVRERFAAAGFEELAFVKPESSVSSIGLNRLTAPPLAFKRGVRLFSFRGS